MITLYSACCSPQEQIPHTGSISSDILRLPELRKTIMELLDKIQFMKDFSAMHKTSDEELLSG